MVLARKYRPQFFREVVGQDIFVHMIRNALRQGRISHGFLLTGIRGVGKTTLARLIAKALTCANLQEDQEPCGDCSSCQALIQEKHLDIMEIDAASHTGVDDIRQILDGCSYRAVMGPYKIFIIDEVHMLSKNAFNALLKTLEEPPPHVKFILATTEVNKVPLTVVSRCQQIHLKRLSPEALIPHLDFICQQEGLKGERTALELLAQHSEGGVRDALSLLERAVLMAEDKKITLPIVQSLLGLPSRQDVEELIQAILAQDIPSILEKARSFYHGGLDPQSILSEILFLLHEEIISQLTTSETNQPSQPISRLDRMWQLAKKGWIEVMDAPFPLACLEMILLRMAYLGRFPVPEEIFSMLEPHSPSRSTSSFKEGPSSTTNTKKITSSPPSEQKPFIQENSPPSFEQLLQALKDQREGVLYTYLSSSITFVAWHENQLELCWIDRTLSQPPTLSTRLEAFLNKWRPQPIPWRILWASHRQGLTFEERQNAYQKEKQEQAMAHPLLAKTKELFPDFILEDLS